MAREKLSSFFQKRPFRCLLAPKNLRARVNFPVNYKNALFYKKILNNLIRPRAHIALFHSRITKKQVQNREFFPNKHHVNINGKSQLWHHRWTKPILSFIWKLINSFTHRFKKVIEYVCKKPNKCNKIQMKP